MSQVEGNKDLREGMQAILNASPGFACVGAYANGKQYHKTPAAK